MNDKNEKTTTTVKGPLSLISGCAHPQPPPWFIACTPEKLRAEKRAARAELDCRLAELRPMLWRLLGDDPSSMPLEYAAMCEQWPTMSWLDHFTLAAAFGERQAHWWYTLKHVRSDIQKIDNYARRLQAALPRNWTPIADEEAAARLIDVVDAARCAEAAKIRVGSKWRTRSGLSVVVIGHKHPGEVRCKFDRDGKETGFGADDFEPGAWFIRIGPTEEDMRGAPIGSLWRWHSATYRIVSHDEDGVSFCNIRARGRVKWENVHAFVGQGAYFKRVVAKGGDVLELRPDHGGDHAS